MALYTWQVVASIQAVAYEKTSGVTTELQVVKCGVTYLNIYVPTTDTCTIVVAVVDEHDVNRRW
jgi:hypothetical protein